MGFWYVHRLVIATFRILKQPKQEHRNKPSLSRQNLSRRIPEKPQNKTLWLMPSLLRWTQKSRVDLVNFKANKSPLSSGAAIAIALSLNRCCRVTEIPLDKCKGAGCYSLLVHYSFFFFLLATKLISCTHDKKWALILRLCVKVQWMIAFIHYIICPCQTPTQFNNFKNVAKHLVEAWHKTVQEALSGEVGLRSPEKCYLFLF